ncbi:glycosyl hydrolase family 28-related protein [Sorangium sp. So ce131]|uniref:right-handed parallel beta-helix repeat-containing protein n=1 Tax=Sorangium sp. So ce131 TaxID=3133282 RepID=UPI003F644A48
MVSKRLLRTARRGLLCALAPAITLAPALAAADPPGAGAVWGYHPPAGESAEYPDLCSLDAPGESPYWQDEDTGVSCLPYPAASPLCTGPSCVNNKCPGTKVLHEDLNACDGASCCKPESLEPGGVVNVLPYLARPTGSPFSADPSVDQSNVDDSPGIAQAIECAASLADTRRTVFFPAGRYVLRSPLRPHYDAITLEGPELSPSAAPGDPDTATLVAIPCNPEQFPGAIQVSETTRPNGSVVGSATWGLWIRNFQIQLTEGPRVRANSGIHLNACSDCEVENIIMRYTPLSPQPASCKPSNLDGIGFSLGSGGVIRNVIVDGVPKGGIYLSSVAGYHDTPPILVENCEIKNINGPVGAGAIKIVTANVTVRNCEVHHSLIHPASGGTGNGGHGLYIFTQPPPAAGIPSPVPSNVLVQDSYFHHNGGAGIVLGSPVEDLRPSAIQLERIRTAYNGSYGVNVQAGTDIHLQDIWSWGNGYYGMYLTSKTTLPATSLRVDDLTVEDPIVFNNHLRLPASQNPAVLIEATDVQIHGGTIARCDPSRGGQSKSIEERSWLTGPAGSQVSFSPEDNCISGVQTHGTSAPTVAACAAP